MGSELEATEPGIRGCNSCTPLAWAVNKGHAEAVKLLIAAGANINVRDELDNPFLKLAVEKRYWYIAALLIRAGATE